MVKLIGKEGEKMKNNGNSRNRIPLIQPLVPLVDRYNGFFV